MPTGTTSQQLKERGIKYTVPKSSSARAAVCTHLFKFGSKGPARDQLWVEKW
jgi:hypothetical protein